MTVAVTIGTGHIVGDGTYGVYNHWEFVDIIADIPDGNHFTSWSIGGNCVIDDPNASSTFIRTGAIGGGESCSASANYAQNPPSTYTLTVNYGTGGGSYYQNDVVNIGATIPDGQSFDHWQTDDPAHVDNIYAASTHVDMPAHALAVTAVFKDVKQVIAIT